MARNTPHLRSLRALGLAAAAALLLTACDDHHRLDSVTAVNLSNPEKRHPIQFASRGETLDVEVPPGAEGLSPNQHVDVYRFLQRYRHEARGRLTVTTPPARGPEAAMARSLQDVQRHLVESGVDYRLLRGARPDARPGDIPTIRLAYQGPVAVAPVCDHWEQDTGRNEERIPYPNWGCASQRNLAVMVDNARDLIVPQPEDPRSGERRAVSWSGYVGAAGGGGDSSSGGADTKKASPAPVAKK